MPNLIPDPVPEVWYLKAHKQPISNHSSPGIIAQRNLVVLHITEGYTAVGAISTFESSIHPYRVSAHFVIDRDGTIYQLLPISDTAWHASAVNSRSVGIEHVALSEEGGKRLGSEGQPATDAQYEASSKLLIWLCNQLNIPIDRQHIATHNECSPQDGHVLCCTGALDPDRLVELAKSNIPT